MKCTTITYFMTLNDTLDKCWQNINWKTENNH